MATTIQLQEGTVELLKMYKKQTMAKTYDEAIKKLMTRNMKELSKKYRGFLGKKNMKFIMEGLRDKNDRY